MQYTIEALLSGTDVESWYRVAREHWAQVLSGTDADDEDRIASIASSEQSWFERNCGGRYIGQEVMVVSGIGQYYQTADGFDDRIDAARAMYRGLVKSMCSVEIHHHARDMAKLYPQLAED